MLSVTGLLLAVCLACTKAEITKHVNVLVHAQKYGLGASPGGLMEGTQFLALGQPVVSSGLQLTTNVRVMASDEPFPTVASMVEDVVCSACAPSVR